MKHTEPEIGQLVYIPKKDIFVRIIDKEIIEKITLFYTDDNSAYIYDELYYLTPYVPDPNNPIENILFSVLNFSKNPEEILKKNVFMNKITQTPLKQHH